jgi:hypothetical protein
VYSTPFARVTVPSRYPPAPPPQPVPAEPPAPPDITNAVTVTLAPHWSSSIKFFCSSKLNTPDNEAVSSGTAPIMPYFGLPIVLL